MLAKLGSSLGRASCSPVYSSEGYPGSARHSPAAATSVVHCHPHASLDICASMSLALLPEVV
jgi:hypothetical protein